MLLVASFCERVAEDAVWQNGLCQASKATSQFPLLSQAVRAAPRLCPLVPCDAASPAGLQGTPKPLRAVGPWPFWQALMAASKLTPPIWRLAGARASSSSRENLRFSQVEAGGFRNFEGCLHSWPFSHALMAAEKDISLSCTWPVHHASPHVQQHPRDPKTLCWYLAVSSPDCAANGSV